MTDTGRAHDIARSLLEEALPRRWAHVQGVADTARTLAPILGKNAGLLTAAAILHDIGYAPRLADTGFHPLDGARYSARCRARRAHALPSGRPPLLRHHRSRRTRPRPATGPRVQARTSRPGRRADLLRHDHRTRRTAHAHRAAASRHPRPIRANRPGHPRDRPLRTTAPGRNQTDRTQASPRTRRCLGRSWSPLASRSRSCKGGRAAR